MLGQALAAFQQSLSVTGNNIANVNTPGYSRQRVNYQRSPQDQYYGVHPFEVGNGVSVTSVTRIRDLLLDASMANAQSDMGKFSSLSSTLQSVEGAFPTPGSGDISSSLSTFFNSWSGLAANPNDNGAKTAVQQAGLALAQQIKGTYAQLKEVSSQETGGITNTFDQIDNLTKEISDLNNQIAGKVAAGDNPNALQDEQTQAIQQLGNLIDIKTYTDAHGAVTVYTNQFELVAPGGANKIPRNYNASTQTLTDPTGLQITVQSGQLVGQMQGLVKTQNYQSQLDTLANTLRTQVNTLSVTGKTTAGTTGIQFFNDSNPQTGAVDFDLSAAVKASISNIPSGTTGSAGDGTLATSLADLQSSPIAGLGNQTFSQFYGALVSGIGNDVSVASNAESTQTALVTQIGNQQQSISGVNLDEEMTNMLKFQQSYAAAAKALSITNSIADNLMSMIQ